jgi:hypothetical protein
MGKRKFIIGIAALSLFISTFVFAANEKKWLKTRQGAGIEVMEPGLKFTPSTVPTNSELGAEGFVYWDSTDNTLKIRSGSSWTIMGARDGIRKAYLPASVFKPQSGGASAAVTGYDQCYVMADGSDIYVSTSWLIPDDWASDANVTMKIHWSTAATSLVGVWGGSWVPVAASEAVTGTGYAFTEEDDTSAATANYLSITNGDVATGSLLAVGDHVILRVGRLGSDASDTLSAAANFLGVELNY